MIGSLGEVVRMLGLRLILRSSWGFVTTLPILISTPLPRYGLYYTHRPLDISYGVLLYVSLVSSGGFLVFWCTSHSYLAGVEACIQQ